MGVQIPTVVAQNGKEGFGRGILAIILYVDPVAGLDFQKALVGKLRDAGAYGCEAYAHHGAKFPCAGKPVADLQLAGQNLILNGADEFLAHGGHGDLVEIHRVLPNNKHGQFWKTVLLIVAFLQKCFKV